MADMLIRDLDDELVEHLKTLAAEHGRSAEDEARAILAAAAYPARKRAALARLREIAERSRPWQPGEPTAAEMIREDRDSR